MAPTASATKKATAKKAPAKKSTASTTKKTSAASKAKKTPVKKTEEPVEEPQEVEEPTTADDAVETIDADEEADSTDAIRKDDEPLYNLYRPQQFSEVVGQATSEVLRRSVADYSAARTYLFTGPRGTGKTSNARLFAAGLFTRTEEHTNGEPDLSNPEARRIISGESMFVKEIDCGRNNGVDQMAQVLDDLRVSYSGKHRVVIFDEAHLLTPRAVSSALKSLEEFKNVTFVLCTTNPEAFPDTIRSRAIVHNMTLLSEEEIKDHIGFVLDKERERYAEIGRDVEVLDLTDEQIEEVVIYANGSARDALSGLQTVISGGELSVYSQGPALVQAILSNDIAEAFAQIMESSNEGVAISGVAQQSISFLNAYLMYCVNQSLVSQRDLSEIERHDAFVNREFKTGDVIRLIRLLIDQRFGQGSDPTRDRQLLELSIVTFANPDTESVGRQAINKIEDLKDVLESAIEDMEKRIEEKLSSLPGGTIWPPVEENLLEDTSDWEEDETENDSDDGSDDEDDSDEQEDDQEEAEEKPKGRRRREIIPQSSDDEDDEAEDGSESDQEDEDEESTDEDDSDASEADSEPEEDDSDEDDSEDDSDEDDSDAEDDVIVNLLAFIEEENADLHEVLSDFADDIRLEDPEDAESPLVIPVIEDLTDEQFDDLVALVREFFDDDEMEVNEDA